MKPLIEQVRKKHEALVFNILVYARAFVGRQDDDANVEYLAKAVKRLDEFEEEMEGIL